VKLKDWWHFLWHEHTLLGRGEAGEYIGLCTRRFGTFPAMIVYQPAGDGMLNEYYPVNDRGEFDTVVQDLGQRWHGDEPVREVEERESPEGSSS
jgi:hypothetical protein